MQEPASRNIPAGCKYSPHPKIGIHPLARKILAELAEGFEPPTL